MNDRFKFRWPLLKDRTNQFIKFVYGDCFVGKPFDPPRKHFGEPEQCTGLKDKNGNLIYEGDICLKNDISFIGYRTRTCRVFWHEKWLGWAIETEYGDVYLLNEFEKGQYEIVGNIHENKELLDEN